jgi:hypothetical protein
VLEARASSAIVNIVTTADRLFVHRGDAADTADPATKEALRYLSGAIIRTRTEYYRLLLEVSTHGQWEPWVIYMLRAVAETARRDRETPDGRGVPRQARCARASDADSFGPRETLRPPRAAGPAGVGLGRGASVSREVTRKSVAG